MYLMMQLVTRNTIAPSSHRLNSQMLALHTLIGYFMNYHLTKTSYYLHWIKVYHVIIHVITYNKYH